MMVEGLITVCICPIVRAEIADVLHRPKVRQRFKSLTQPRVDAFLEQLDTKTLIFQSVPKIFSYSRDPDDEPYINLAAAARAAYLVTWDKDLLVLMDAI
jgi:putative PIN family toxin of toxin-antitoxin system